MLGHGAKFEQKMQQAIAALLSLARRGRQHYSGERGEGGSLLRGLDHPTF